MPLGRAMVEPVLGTFGEKGCTAARLAKKLTNQMNGAVITSAELEQFLQRALDDRPAWLLQIDDRWAYIDVSQRVDEPAVPEDSTDELVTSNIEGEQMKKRFWTMLSWCVLPFIWIWAILCALWGKIVDWFVATRGRRVERTIVVLIIVLIIALFWKGLFPFSTNQSQSVQPAPVASSEATVQQEQGGVQAPPPAPEMAPVEQNVSARIEKSRVSRKRAREILKKIKD